MGKITKNKLDNKFKKVYDKQFRKDVQEFVKKIAKDQIGDAGAESVVIKDISLEIIPVDIPLENLECKGSSAKSKRKTSKSNASTRCYIYCYVIGGSRVCRVLWCE
jgi:hypothetical protein